jgi:lipopolysaccharide export system ATP-binding protein
MPSCLECRGLKKIYGTRTVVNDVGFHVERGEIVGLLGANGAGKTTSFRMTCGMIAPTAGQVLLDGADVTDWPMFKRARKGMGYLAQESSVFVKLSVEDNILAILELLHLGRQERKNKTAALLEDFGLTKLARSIASTLSGGERRRLEIARCLASQPALILLDEPFTGIDPVTIQQIQEIIRRLRNSGIAILLTDHREMETLTITDRNYIIHEGRVLISGDAQTVLRDEAAQRAYFGKRSYHDVGMLNEVDKGAPEYKFHMHLPGSGERISAKSGN